MKKGNKIFLFKIERESIPEIIGLDWIEDYKSWFWEKGCLLPITQPTDSNHRNEKLMWLGKIESCNNGLDPMNEILGDVEKNLNQKKSVVIAWVSDHTVK